VDFVRRPHPGAGTLGAAASIAFGLLILNKVHKGADRLPEAAPHDSATTATAAAGPVAIRSRQTDDMALAVLPLQNFSGDAQQDFFAAGMTEALTADLAQTHGLRVVSRTSAMRYTHHDHTLPAIARELDVDLIVEGSIIRAGDRVRITAQLIDATSDEHLWSRSYDDSARDVLGAQSRVAAAIATEVRGAAAAAGQRRRAAREVNTLPHPGSIELVRATARLRDGS
jgi:TolB-like protein